MKTIAIVGCGRLATVVVEAMKCGFLPGYSITGAYSRTCKKAEDLASMVEGCKAYESIDQLIESRPDYIVEAASPAAMKAMAIQALEKGISIVTLSIGAFADDVFYSAVSQAASKSGARVYIASGATGGFDVLQTATLMGEYFAMKGGEKAKAEFFNEKGPNALKGTPVYKDSLQDESEIVFEGTARQAIEMFPTKVNVTVAASRASVNPGSLQVTIKSTPGFIGDTQCVTIFNEQVKAVVDVYSSTPEIAAWSIVAVLRNIVSPIVF